MAGPHWSDLPMYRLEYCQMRSIAYCATSPCRQLSGGIHAGKCLRRPPLWLCGKGIRDCERTPCGKNLHEILSPPKMGRREHHPIHVQFIIISPSHTSVKYYFSFASYFFHIVSLIFPCKHSKSGLPRKSRLPAVTLVLRYHPARGRLQHARYD